VTKGFSNVTEVCECFLKQRLRGKQSGKIPNHEGNSDACIELFSFFSILFSLDLVAGFTKSIMHCSVDVAITVPWYS